MQWTTALSERVDPRQAIGEAADAACSALGGPPDLAFLFASSHYADSYASLARWADELLSAKCLIGCGASGVIGNGREVEQRDAVALVCASLPGVELSSFHLPTLPEQPDPGLWPELLGVRPEDAPNFVLLCDPFADVDLILRGLDLAYPSAPKVGGLASGTEVPGQPALFRGSEVLAGGVLGISLGGDVRMDTLVAQGCRPVGEPMIVTRCAESIIYELNVGRPVDVLQRLFETLEPRDQELCRHSLFLGIEMNDAHRYKQGDFLIRSLAGVDPEGGAMAVTGHCHDYQVVQFHLRDSRTSSQDLEVRLARAEHDAATANAQGALLFSCTGRGRALYGESNHDTDAFCRHFGSLPLGGFFGNGEIGPVGDATFLHGYTSAFAFFSEPG